MDIVYPICCGVDVHKKFIVATVIKTTDQIRATYTKERFCRVVITILLY